MTEAGRTPNIRFWKGVRCTVRAFAALTLALAVFLVTKVGGDETAPVLPDTASLFSLDLRVVGSADHDVVYAVEQRARPAYRILAFDPRSGEDTTIFTVPEDAIIYGLALSPDRSTLAVSYSPDFNLDGSGVWTLDIDSSEFTKIVDVEPSIYLTEPEFSSDGQTIYTTYVDRSGDGEALSIAAVSLQDQSAEIVLEQAITPAVTGEVLTYLTVDDQNARRSIGVLSADGSSRDIAIGGGTLDLDHLIVERNGGELHVAVLELTDEPALTLGEPADAHGNHNVASTWWEVDTETAETTASAVEPIIVYDAAIADGGSTIVYATLEGLAIATDERIELIASRAIRFVAA